MRRFAVDELGLAEQRQLHAPTLRSIGPMSCGMSSRRTEFSVDPQRWCFPFAGCVAYRGFFDKRRRGSIRAGARRRRARHCTAAARRRIRRSGTSTIPVLSTMVDGGEPVPRQPVVPRARAPEAVREGRQRIQRSIRDRVEELRHGTLAAAARNEHGDSRVTAPRIVQRADFGELIAAQQARLRAVYATDAPGAAARRQSAGVRHDAGRVRGGESQRWGGSSDYDAWFHQPLNNATLASVATYTRWLPALRAALRRSGSRRSTPTRADREARCGNERSSRAGAGRA